MVVTSRDRTARDSNQVGSLGSGKGLAIALLSLVLEDPLQPTFPIALTDLYDGIAAHIEGGTHLGFGPAFGQLEQNMGAGQRSSIGPTPMDKGLEQGSISLGQRQRWG